VDLLSIKQIELFWVRPPMLADRLHPTKPEACVCRHKDSLRVSQYAHGDTSNRRGLESSCRLQLQGVNSKAVLTRRVVGGGVALFTFANRNLDALLLQELCFEVFFLGFLKHIAPSLGLRGCYHWFFHMCKLCAD